MPFNRDDANGGKPFDIGDDYKRFLENQPPGQDPNNPNAPKLGEGRPEDSVGTPGAPGSEVVSGDEGNAQGPRDRGTGSPQEPVNPDLPKPGQSPSPESGTGPTMTPPQPTSPSPVATGPGHPSQPLPSPRPEDMTRPAQQFGALGSGSMLGSAGGLLGGGLGTAGALGSTEGGDNSLLNLLMLLQQGQ